MDAQGPRTGNGTDKAGFDERRLAGFPGAALAVALDGTVLAANIKGSGIEALLAHGAVPEILELLQQANAARTIATGTMALQGATGEIVLEATAIPGGEGDPFVLLVRDLTMERNLRSALIESRQRYKDLVEVSSDLAWEVGKDGILVFVSPKGALGYRAEELVGRAPAELVLDPDQYAPLPFLTDRPLDDVELWMHRADGGQACMVTSCLPLLADDDTWRGARGVCRDVTAERDREAALTRARHREHLLNYIVNTIRDELEPRNMLNTAAAASARALGATGCRVYRRTGGEAFTIAAEYGKSRTVEGLDPIIARVDDERHFVEATEGPWAILAAATHYRQSINGAICMWKDTRRGIWSDDDRLLIGDVANQLGIANEQIANHERIVRLSRTDGLTGLLNRRAFFEEELPRRLHRLERENRTAALFFVDMDNFKRVNDAHGHLRGDEAILALRDMLVAHTRPGDVVARLGGDEFAMWLDGIGADTVAGRAVDMLETSRGLRVFSGDADHPLGISIGVAMYDPHSGEKLDDLLARADTAMYRVKHGGKGGYAMAEPPADDRGEAP